MKTREIKPGVKVKLHTRQGDFECVILESPSKEVVLVKLNSGYNIGLMEEDILDLKVIHEKKIVDEIKSKVEVKKDLPNIALVVTGGTISSRLDSKTGAVKWLTESDELLKFYPEILEIANIAKIEVPFMKASEDMDCKDWTVIAETVANLLNDSKIEGVIVTHGTDFLHYTAVALSFALENLNKPVVLTYSQRSSDRASSDARLNLQCAARVAVSDIAEVMLVGHGTIDDNFCLALPGTKVRKMHTSRRDTFRPINSRAIAKVFQDKIEPFEKYNVRDNKKRVELKNKFSDKVALVKFYPGMKSEIFDYFLNEKYKGLVVELSGLGHLSTKDSRNDLIAKIKKLVSKGVIVCGVAQTIYGKVDPLVYSNGRELEKTGMLFLGDMLSETALVKLSWVLGDSNLRKNSKENMLRNFTGEFSDFISEDEFLN
ncbi:MAG: Glu-tRNA(Gln) amidotransferase subunit GatD [Nanoarchaeota archaeon]|nr:Glu-tRNA(Gln) amidotransferase subunit GatD [Nanoarchaeota archaeon]